MGRGMGRYRAAAAAVLIAAVLLTYTGSRSAPSPDREIRLNAAERMRRCMEAVAKYKTDSGLAIPGYDWFRTGLLGDEFTFITTTIAPLEAKRTTANPDMAALMAALMRQAGVKEGDTVGAGFSGSFPAMNIATACACDAMGVKLIYIASVGASTYGANQPEMTSPDMLFRLYQDGLISTPPAAFTPGGDGDAGRDMDPDTLRSILLRLESTGIPLLKIDDYTENLKARRDIYVKNGPISCFIGVGGNLTTSGRNQADLPAGVILPGASDIITDKSGLMETYSADGLPVIHILNIRRLVADYGLPYDPESLPAPGESAIYYETEYPKVYAAAGLLLALALMLWGRKRKRGMGP